jgi:uncharacterized protein (TIGR02611 family)
LTVLVVLRRIAEQREKLIVAHADDHLDDGEEVQQWVRASRVGARGDGFIYLTQSRVIVHLSGSDEDNGGFGWEELEAWGVATDVRGGPVLALETEDGHCVVQLRAQTEAMARDVKEFLERIGEMAPVPRRPVKTRNHIGEFEPVKTVEVQPYKLSIGGQAKRIIITIVGAALIIFALLIIPLPGPWSILISIGGFAILAQEYDWAKDALEWFKTKYEQAKKKISSRRRRNTT